jgi:hypothetical protein
MISIGLHMFSYKNVESFLNRSADLGPMLYQINSPCAEWTALSSINHCLTAVS